jgi:hypothetical protein
VKKTVESFQTMTYKIQKCRTTDKNVGTAPSGFKLTLFLLCTFVFYFLGITCVAAGEQPEEKSITNASPKKEITVVTEDPASNTHVSIPSEDNNAVSTKETNEAPQWQELKLDTPKPIDAVKNSNCPCDSTGVRSRLMRMGGGDENGAGSGWSGRGMSGGMGRGRR